jgi:2-polyprenyl-6-methoxyphenol hydroxylase-like FAD-dependent oxidoreductase
MPADAFGGEGIVAEIEVLRGDLCRILLETTRGSVEYVFGDSIAALNESGSHVSVRFENGKTRDFAFEDVGWRVPALLDSMREASDFYFGSVCQVFVDRWSRGRTVLLGDAAYCASPLTGLGTSMALVGA